MDDKLLLQIDAYLSDSLSTEDKVTFERKIKQDKELEKEILLVKRLNIYLSNDAEKEIINETAFSSKIKTELNSKDAKVLNEKLLRIKKEYHKENSKNKTTKNFFLVAASVALLVLGALGLYMNKSTSSEKLFAQYYSSNDLPAIIKRGDNQTQFEKGVVYFNNKNYKKALNSFRDYKTNDITINPSVYIYTGVSYWELNENEKAIIEFDKMINSNSIDNSKGLWFKALLYMKIGDENKAKTTLLQLTTKNTNYKYKEAKELLTKI